MMIQSKAYCFSLHLPLTPDPWPLTPNAIVRKDLRVYKLLYNCKETFTDVMSALQNNLFMQNKANFRKVELNVNKVLSKVYEKRILGGHGKTKPIQTQYKPNTNPIQTQYKPNSKPIKPKFKKAKMNVTSYITKEYENISNWAICENEPKTNPIQTQFFRWFGRQDYRKRGNNFEIYNQYCPVNVK